MDIRDIFFIEDSSGESDDEISFISSSNLKQTTTTTTTSTTTTTTELLPTNKFFSNGINGSKFGNGIISSSSSTNTKTVEKPFVNYDEKNNPYLVGLTESPIDLDEIVQEQKNNRINKNNSGINGINGKTTTTTDIVLDLDDSISSMKIGGDAHKSTTLKSHTLEKYNEQRKQILNVTSSLQQKKTSDSSSPKNNKTNNEGGSEEASDTTLMDDIYAKDINILKNKNEKKRAEKEKHDKLRFDKERSISIKEERDKLEKEKAEKLKKEKELKKLHEAKIKSAISMVNKTKETEEREKQAKQNAAQERAQLEKKKQLDLVQAKLDFEKQEKKKIVDQAAKLESQRIEKEKIEAIKLEAKRLEQEKQKQQLESEKLNQIKSTKIENDRLLRLEKERKEKEISDAAAASAAESTTSRAARKRVQSYVTDQLRMVTLNKLVSCLDSENTIVKKLDAPIRKVICEQIEKISFDSSTTKQDYIKKVAGQYTLIVGGKIQTYLIPFLPQPFISSLSPSQITQLPQPMSVTQSQSTSQSQLSSSSSQPPTPIKPMASTISPTQSTSPLLQSSSNTTPTSSEIDKEFSLLKFEDCIDAITSEKIVHELYNDYSKLAFPSSTSLSMEESIKLLRKYRKLISSEYSQPIDNIVLILLSLITNENFSQLKQKYLQLYKDDLNNGLISRMINSNLNIEYFEPLNEYIQKKQNRLSLFKIEESDLINNGSAGNVDEINLNIKISKASNRLEKEFLNIFDNAGRLKKKQTKINFLSGSSSSMAPHSPPTETKSPPTKSSNKVCYNCKKNGYKCPGGIPCGKCLNIGLLCDKSSNFDIEFEDINGGGFSNLTGKKRKSLEVENTSNLNANSISNYFEVGNNNNNSINNNNNNNTSNGNGIDQNKKPKVEAQWIEKDIANGVYTYPLRAVNECDDVPLTNSLINFKWIEKSFCDRETSNIEEFLFGCDCVGDCYNNRDKCLCIQEGGIHYDDNGCIISNGDNEIVECNAKCKCSHERCKNRAIQHGQQNSFPLELYKTRDKGWSVRTCVDIPKFTYVCEYVGEIISHEVAEERGERYDDQGLSYLYDLTALEGENCLAIDATYYGNVARFVNHSCNPNLKAYNFFFDQKIEITKPRIAFFSTRNIKEGEELHFDYRYILPPGVSNKKDIPGGIPCHCGSAKCRKWLWVPQYQKHSSRR